MRVLIDDDYDPSARPSDKESAQQTREHEVAQMALLAEVSMRFKVQKTETNQSTV